MAIVHDLAEAIVGDITPHSGVTKEAKYQMEREAMDDMVKTLGSTKEALEIQALWQEYENAATLEALFVKDLDKFEMIVQALEYEKRKERGKKRRMDMNLPYLAIANRAQGAS